MLDVGNGGAGPGEGLRRLDVNEIDFETASRQFPFESFSGEKHDVQKRNYSWSKRHHGSITLAHYGCGEFAELVLNGEYAGEVWMSNWPIDLGIQRFGRFISQHNPLIPVGDFGCRFDDWYDSWLSGLMEMISRGDD